MAYMKQLIRAHRIFTVQIPFNGVTPGSVVMVSLTEIGRSNPAGSLDMRFIGDATMKVYNVSPAPNTVWVRGEIDWDDDLDIEIAIFVA